MTKQVRRYYRRKYLKKIVTAIYYVAQTKKFCENTLKEIQRKAKQNVQNEV